MMKPTSALSPPGRVPVQKVTPNLNPSTPLFGQNTYFERLKYCFSISNPLLLFTPKNELRHARCIVHELRNGNVLPSCVSPEEVIKLRIIYESSYNPFSGHLVGKLYRISALAPVNALILGSVLTYYQCTRGILFAHTFYQGFTTLRSYKYSCPSYNVNLGNALLSFLVATGISVGTATLVNNYFKCSKILYGRFSPLAAVVAGTLIGTPLLHMDYLTNGAPVYDKYGCYLGLSKEIGYNQVFVTTFNRIAPIIPGMALSPFIIQNLYNRGFICRYPWTLLPINIGLMFGFLLISIPLSCAIFDTRVTVPADKLKCCTNKWANEYCAHSCI